MERFESVHLMTTAETARLLRMSEAHLETMRIENRGPPFLRLGAAGIAKVVYRLSDVETWLEQYATKGQRSR